MFLLSRVYCHMYTKEPLQDEDDADCFENAAPSRREPGTLTGVYVNSLYSWLNWRQSTWLFSFPPSNPASRAAVMAALELFRLFPYTRIYDIRYIIIVECLVTVLSITYLTNFMWGWMLRFMICGQTSNRLDVVLSLETPTSSPIIM